MQKSRENYREALPPGQMSCQQHFAVFGVVVLVGRVHTQTPCVLHAIERRVVTRRPHFLGLRRGIFVTRGGPGALCLHHLCLPRFCVFAFGKQQSAVTSGRICLWAT